MANVLLVDDHEDICEVLKHLLEMHGHQVQVCSSGEAALQYLRGNAPDAVIADERLPGISGLELLQHILQDDRLSTTPVIICSADDSHRQEAQDAGASDFWLKGSDQLFDALEDFGRTLSKLNDQV